MTDKIDELINMIGGKKSLMWMIVAYVIITAIIIAIIWWPEEKNYATYTKVDIEDKKSEMAQSYVNALSDLFQNGRKEELKELISSRYIRYTGKSVDEIVTELEDKKFLSEDAEVKGVKVYADKDTYVYSTTVYSDKGSRVVNVIERYPYEYEIVFDDFYSYDEADKATVNKDIRFTIQNIYRNLKYIEISMEIENLNSVYARFDFNSTVGVQAVLEDGTIYPIANLVSDEAYTNIESNMTIKKNFVFEIPAQLQDGIKYIVFNGVKIEFSETNIKINI